MKYFETFFSGLTYNSAVDERKDTVLVFAMEFGSHAKAILIRFYKSFVMSSRGMLRSGVRIDCVIQFRPGCVHHFRNSLQRKANYPKVIDCVGFRNFRIGDYLSNRVKLTALSCFSLSALVTTPIRRLVKIKSFMISFLFLALTTTGK